MMLQNEFLSWQQYKNILFKQIWTYYEVYSTLQNLSEF